jgi:hypothetical protein
MAFFYLNVYSREVLALKPERYGLTNENETYNLAGKEG